MKNVNIGLSIFVGLLGLLCCYKFFTVYEVNYFFAMLCCMLTSVIFYLFYMLELMREKNESLTKQLFNMNKCWQQARETYRF